MIEIWPGRVKIFEILCVFKSNEYTSIQHMTCIHIEPIQCDVWRQNDKHNIRAMRNLSIKRLDYILYSNGARIFNPVEPACSGRQ